MTKYTLLVAPCQSGKTSKMFTHMLGLFGENASCINLIFTDNSILQTQQLCSRLNKQAMFDTFKNDDGELSLVLSSKSNVKDYMNLPFYFAQGYKNIIMCSNTTRVKSIEKIIAMFPAYTFNILIDEVDRNIGLFYDKIVLWNEKDNIGNILMVTATPNRVLLKLGPMKIIKLEKSYFEHSYHRFQDSEFKFYEYDDTCQYVEKVLSESNTELENQTVWFVPSNIVRTGHYDIKDICLSYDMNCITINSDGCFLWLSHKKKKIVFNMSPDEELSDTLARIYLQHNLHRKPLAITGMLCISRGITISSKTMLISHAILPPKMGSHDGLYQLSARVSGNFRHLPNWRTPKVYCTEDIYKRVVDSENKAIGLAERCFKTNRDVVYRSDYIQAASKFLFYESPAFDTLDELQKFIDENDLKAPKKRTHSHIDGFYVSHTGGRLLHQKRKSELVSDDRLILTDFNKIPVHSQLTDNNTHAKTIIFPVYENMESDAKVNWYVRYRTPCLTGLTDGCPPGTRVEV